MHKPLVENLSGLGLEFVVDAAYRLPQLNLVKVPEGVDELLCVSNCSKNST